MEESKPDFTVREKLVICERCGYRKFESDNEPTCIQHVTLPFNQW